MSTTQTEYGGNFYGPLILHKRCKIKQTIFVHVRESRAKYKLTVSIIQVSFFHFQAFQDVKLWGLFFKRCTRMKLETDFGVFYKTFFTSKCAFFNGEHFSWRRTVKSGEFLKDFYYSSMRVWEQSAQSLASHIFLK